MTEYGDVADEYDPHRVEAAVADRWATTEAYRKTKDHRSDGESFYFLDGPPYTNGDPHLGHAWNKSLKDCYIRYHRMLGYDVLDRPGWDMHGLPIETRVEERLGFENKRDIEAFGMEAFIDECSSYAEEYLETLQAAFQDLGVWMDWDDPYKTLNPEYMEATWWAFKQAHERGLVEQGKRSISQCPRCETAIAKNEIEYEQVEDPSIYVRFPLREREGDLVIWTTTPWTIPGNTFVAVDPALTYQAVRATRDGEEHVLWLAEPCVESVLKAGRYDDFEVIESRPGTELIGWRYDPPLGDVVSDHPGGEASFTVYGAEYVEADRTGLVHSAPGHGEEDFERGLELDLPLFCPVGEDGVFTEAGGAYAGEFVRDANETIRRHLDDRGLLLADETINHDYGHCWRCDTAIIQIVTDQWFVTVTDIKDDLLANIEDSTWYPDWARDNRFRDFVENSPDWNVSRQRYWGTPLPIWVPEDAPPDELDEDMLVIGTRDELADRVDQDIDPADLDLHRPTVDELTITEGGTTYVRIPDVFDVWLDSAVAPWGSLDFPEDADALEEHFPADLIIEAHDQTRGWFWSMLGMGSATVDEIPYQNVLMYGFALMPDGRAMSKSKGLIIDPYEAMESHGVDILRLSLLSYNPQGEDMRFSWDTMDALNRQLTILWNVFRFPLPYMELDDIEPGDLSLSAVDDDLTTLDEWLLSRLHSTIEAMGEHMAEYRQDRAVEALLELIVEDLSRFYLQTVRDRMWSEDPDDPSKLAAYATLCHVLEQVTVLLAPFAPFISDRIYAEIAAAPMPTVHMADWPSVDDRWLDQPLEDDIAVVRAVEEAGANARQAADRPLRWPIQRVVIAAGDDRTHAAIDRQRALIADRLNARAVELVVDETEWEALQYSAEADMSKLGPAFGADAQTVMHALNEASLDEPDLSALEAAVEAELGESIDLDPEMVTFVTETPAGISGGSFSVDGDDRGVVYVDAQLTEALESEGYAREVIRRIQEMRKELDLDIDQPIRVEYAVADDRIAELIDGHTDLIATEVRATAVGSVEDGLRRSWDIEETTVEIAVSPVD